MRPIASRNFILLQIIICSFFSCLANVSMGQTVASFSASHNIGCAPLNVNFTNASTGATSYSWNFGNSSSSTQPNPSNVYSTPGTYTVTLTATGTSGVSSSIITIEVLPSPTANFIVLQNSACQYSGIISFQNLSSSYDSCVWDFGDGTTSNVQNPQHIYSIAGSFIVKLVVYNKQYGCNSVYTINNAVTIFPAPTAQIYSSDTITCNQNNLFNFTSVNFNSISWLWDFGDGHTSNLTNPTHVYIDTGSFDVSIILTSANGCINTITKDNWINILVNPIPTITSFQDTGCSPHRISLSTPFVNDAIYLWNIGSTLTDSLSSVYSTIYDQGIYPVSLNIQYLNGCQQTVQHSPIVVYERPDVIYSMSNSIGCGPLNVQFSNTTIGNHTWLWDFGDGQTSNLYAPNHIYTTPGTFQINLTATSADGCSFGYPLNAKVKVYSPVALFSADVVSGCPPLIVNFTSQSTGGTNYFWDFGDGSTSNLQYPTHAYNSTGIYTVKLVVSDNTGCSDTLIKTNYISVASGNINYVSPATITACAPYSVNFGDASDAASYLWDFGDGTTSNLSNPNHVYNTPGVYVVSVTTQLANGGCEISINNFQTFIIDGVVLDFSYTVSSCPPYEVYFVDSSVNTTNWHWSFGDGGSSSQQNPSYIFPNPGNYDITLTATTVGGCSAQLFVSDGVQITGLGASATASSNDTIAPYTVQFYSNATNASWYLWTFGDGDSSSLSDPVHDFVNPGPYNISLTIGNDSCEFTYDYPPITFGSSSSSGGGLGGGGLVIEDTIYHCAPYVVTFSNPVPDALYSEWHFGDGVISNQNSPEHSYLTSGAFNAYVIITNQNLSIDTLFFSETYFVHKPISDFDITTINTCIGVIVNTKTAEIGMNYLWNFGNGNTITNPNASFTYPNVNASYMISLAVVDTFGCSSFVAKSFIINATSPLNASSRKICAGDSILVSSGNLNYQSYLWDLGNNVYSAEKSPKITYLAQGNYTITLTVTDINGCVQQFSLSYQIDVYDPIADFSFTPPQSNCTTLFVEFNNLSQNSDDWLWHFGDSTTSNQWNPTHIFSDIGLHDITLIANKNVCSDTLVLPNAIYVSQLIPKFVFNPDTACSPALISFIDESIDAVDWYWQFGDGDTSTLQNPQHNYVSSIDNPIRLTTTDVNGCVKSISVNPPVITDANFSFSNSLGCSPLTVTFMDSSSNAISWFWDFGDGNTSNIQNPIHTYSQDGYYSVTLIVTSRNGCTDTIFVDSLVNVDTPIANFVSDIDTGCNPLLVNFINQSTNAVLSEWSFGNGSSSVNQDPSLIYTDPGTFSVQLMVTNKFGCTASISRDSLVNVFGSVSNFSLNNISGCLPFMISPIDFSFNAVSWNWNFGDGNIDTLQNPIHTYLDTGRFIVSLTTTDTSGCTSVYLLPDTIVVQNPPVASFTISDSIGCAPFSIQIDSQFAIADSLIWDMGDGTILYGDNPTYTYTQPGIFQITLIAKNGTGCSRTLIYPSSIVVNSTPQANFSMSRLVGCTPLQIDFLNLSTNLENATYLWDFGNGDTDTSFSSSYTYLSDGDFIVTLSIINQGGCSSVYSSPDTLIVYDSSPPDPTSLYRASVVTNHSTEINWKLNLNRDIAYYNIYRFNPVSATFDSIANIVWSKTSTNGSIPHFVDSNLNTWSKSYTYKVQTVNMCGSKPELFLTKEHTTINVESVPSFMRVDVSWTPYSGCDFFNYEIYRADVNGTFTLIATVDTSINTFTDTTTICPFPYTYRIKATSICNDPGYDSWSDSTIATPTSNIQDQSVEIVRSTVVNNSYVLTEWKKPSLYSDFVEHYDIYRSSDDINFTLIATVPSLVQDYSDMNVDVNQNRYTYKVFPGTSCNIQSASGNISSNILLEALQSEFTNDLKWTRYVNWDSGVEKYVIEKLNSAGNWEQIKVLNGSITNWTEE